VTGLTVNGDQVSFKVTMKYNDTEVPMEFKGKLDGGTLKGEFTTSRGSARPSARRSSDLSVPWRTSCLTERAAERASDALRLLFVYSRIVLTAEPSLWPRDGVAGLAGTTGSRRTRAGRRQSRASVPRLLVVLQSALLILEVLVGEQQAGQADEDEVALLQGRLSLDLAVIDIDAVAAFMSKAKYLLVFASKRICRCFRETMLSRI